MHARTVCTYSLEGVMQHMIATLAEPFKLCCKHCVSLLPLKFTYTAFGSASDRNTLFRAWSDWLMFLPSSRRCDADVLPVMAACLTFSLPARSTKVSDATWRDTCSPSLSLSLLLSLSLSTLSLSLPVFGRLSLSASLPLSLPRPLPIVSRHSTTNL